MAKGLGAILATVAAREQADRLAAGAAVACPVCGVEMEATMGRFYCWSGDDEPCIDTDEYADVHHAFYDACGRLDTRYGNPVILAAVIANGEPLVELRIMVGGYYESNLRIKSIGVATVVPALIRRHGWTWQDWVPDKYTR